MEKFKPANTGDSVAHHSFAEIAQRIALLEKKYAAAGQDIVSYLDGLIYADYITYWEYVNLDVLLNIQHPLTSFPDEVIFITYHQITELYFSLIRHAIHQITDAPLLTYKLFVTQMQRVSDYIDQLNSSFVVMITGMDKDQFLKFRMSLLPASGFQSVQIRQIELLSTPVANLLTPLKRPELLNTSPAMQYQNIYWKSGATEIQSNQKTLTLKQFEVKYDTELLQLATDYNNKNLYTKYLQLPENEKNADGELEQLLKKYDQYLNVGWKLMHLKAATRFLHKSPEDLAATGGTNWQKYLPAKNQQIIFFPTLYTPAELENWGRKM